MAADFESFSSFLQSTSESQPRLTNNDSATASENGGLDSSSYVPRPKRIACIVCRRRKLKCDSQRPSCGNCSRLGHHCAYDEVRKKSGPKRGYVKQLEARLEQVETLLQSQDPNPVRTQPSAEGQESTLIASNESNAPKVSQMPQLPTMPDVSTLPFLNEVENPIPSLPQTSGPPPLNQPFTTSPNLGTTGSFQWDMIDLGLEEPLPNQDIIDELYQIYFEKIHPSMPLIHRPRYFTAMSFAPNMRPPVCLRYIMWCHAAMVTDKYFLLHEHFYHRARKYAEIDEMKGFGEGVLSLAYSQCIILIGMYEFKRMYFPRAWITVGKAARLVIMMGFNRMDAWGFDVKQYLPPPKDWTEREERRRAFWFAFCADRYAGIGTGWAMVFDERDILTNLPATDESYVKSKPEPTVRLADAMLGEGISSLSPMGGVVLLASLLGRNLTHIHRPEAHDNDYDLSGEFWKRHRAYDNILLNFALSLPSGFRLPAGIGNPNVVFCNLAIHTSAICLHQAAIFKAEKNKMPSRIVTESKRRCIVAADQISSIMKMISHMDLSGMNPFMAFCIYSAARVFVQYLKSCPHDSTVRSSLEFILNALTALKTKNPLCESFLAQLDVDIEGIGLRLEDPTRRPPSFSPCRYMGNAPDSGSTAIGQSAVADQSSQQGTTPSDPSSLVYCQSNVPAADSFPQQAQSAVQQPYRSGNLNNNGTSTSTNSPHYPTAGVALEMDHSSEVRMDDWNNNPLSDNPISSTSNPSSNANPSLPNPTNSSGRDPNPSTHASPDNMSTSSFTSVPCPFSRLFSNYSTESPNYERHGNGYSKLPTWDSSVNPAPELNDINTTQLSQMLSGANWDGW